MAKSSRSKAEEEYLGHLANLGCSICYGPAAIHHPTGTFYKGLSGRAWDLLAIPLCPPHHQTGGRGVAYHAGPETWERKFRPQGWHIIKNWHQLRIDPETILAILEEGACHQLLVAHLREMATEFNKGKRR